MDTARRALLLILPLCTLLLAVWAGVTIVQNPPYVGAELLSNGTVHDVDAVGPAYEAGLRLGDHVLAVDGRPFLGHFTLVHGKRPGETLDLSGRRDGTPFRVDVVLGEVTQREFVFSLERLFVGVIFWIVGVGIWLLRPAASAARRFYLVSQVMAGMFFGEILDPGMPSMTVLTDFSRYLVAPLLLHFFASFPRPISPPLRSRLLGFAYGGYALVAAAVAAGIAFRLDLYASGVWMAPRVFEVIVGVMVVAVLLRPHPSASLNTRRWRGILVAGMLLGITPVMLTLISMVVSGGRPIVPYEWTVPALALTPLSYGYAVYKTELSAAGMVLNRSLVYFLLTFLLLGVYSLLYLAVDAVFGPDRGWAYLISGMVIVVAGSTLFVPIRTRLQHWVDRLFYGGWYDYRSFVQSVGNELSRFTDLRDLAAQLKDAAETMRFTKGVLLWPRGERFHPIGSFGFQRKELYRLRVPVDGSISTALRDVGAPCVQAELCELVDLDTCPESEAIALSTPEFAHWIPLISRGSLRSILVAGPRHGSEELDHEDRDILSTLSTQAAIACDNIALFESLQDRLSEVERIRDELAEAQTRLTEGREEERKRLARELHDGPIQDLYAVLHNVEMIAEEDGIGLKSRLNGWHQTVQRIVGTLRDVCIELRPPLLADFGLEVTMRSHAARFRGLHPDIHVEIDLIPLGVRLPERVQLALFRIFQEALNNAAQHGRARSIRVRLEADAEGLHLEIVDDGCGFVVPTRWIEFARRGHLGLLGIAERAGSIGGRLEVVSEPGGGTRLHVGTPLHDEPGLAAYPTYKHST